MGRPKKQNREPFWRCERNCWYVQHGTRQIRLSSEKDDAWRLWHEFMARPPEEDRPIAPGPDIQVIEILDAYLDWCHKHKSERTYEWSRENIQRFSSAVAGWAQGDRTEAVPSDAGDGAFCGTGRTTPSTISFRR